MSRINQISIGMMSFSEMKNTEGTDVRAGREMANRMTQGFGLRAGYEQLAVGYGNWSSEEKSRLKDRSDSYLYRYYIGCVDVESEGIM